MFGNLIGMGLSFVNGMQQRSAATNAAKAQEAASLKAIATMNGAADKVNPQIGASYDAAGNLVMDTSQQAAGNIRGVAADAGAGVNTAAVSANERLDPYATAGTNAVQSMAGMDGEKFVFNEDDPSFQYRLQTANKALERSAAARGSLSGGGTLTGLQRQSQQMASQEYQAAFQRHRATQQDRLTNLSTLANFGLNASGQAGRNTLSAAEYGGNMNYSGEARAGGLEVGGATYKGNAGIESTSLQARNTLGAAEYQGNAEMGIGNAQAAGHMVRADAWSSALKGGADGAASFKLSDFRRKPALGNT